MSNPADAIKAVCARYVKKQTSDTELCAWVRDRIYEKITGYKNNSTHKSIKFRGALIEFIEDNALFCAYLPSEEGEVLDVTFPLTMYIQREYGVQISNAFLKTINLSYLDAMDLAAQITDEICVWVGLAEDTVLT